MILDLLMGGRAGFALCEELGSSVPVVALSALDHRDRALAGGAQAFLRKPFEPLRLVSVTPVDLGSDHTRTGTSHARRAARPIEWHRRRVVDTL